MSAAKLCVVLLNYANWRDTLECLESLARTSYPALSAVVVDTGSTNDSVARLRAWARGEGDARPRSDVWRQLPSVPARRPHACENVEPDGPAAEPRSLPLLSERLILLPSRRRLGFAAGCNAGLRIALADPEVRYLWLLNNDAIVESEAPSRLVACAAPMAGSLGALGTLIAEYRHPDRIQMLGGGRVRRFSAEPVFLAHGLPIGRAAECMAQVEALDYISGASLFTRAEAVREVGFLDETMHLYWEDTDWCARLRAAGLQLGVCPQAIVWHKGHASTGGINGYTKYHSLRSAVVYMRKHRRRWLPPLLVRLSKSFVRDLARWRPAEAMAGLRGFAAGLDAARRGRDRSSRPGASHLPCGDA